MASSWFIGKASQWRQNVMGLGQVKTNPYEGPITMKDDWYISNSLPYAERVAFDPMWAKNGRRGGADGLPYSERPAQGR